MCAGDAGGYAAFMVTDSTARRRMARHRPRSDVSEGCAGTPETGVRTVLVTGASGGIGRATVRILLEEGFAVWAAVRDEAGRDALIADLGDRVGVVVFDVTDGPSVAEAAAVIDAQGPLYALVNNAGAALPGPLEYVPIEQFRRQLEINLVGQLRVTQALMPALRRGVDRWGDARIVLMGSMDGRIVGPLFGPYAASKHALVGLADGLRSELGPSGLKVVLLEPGAVATPIWRRGVSVLDELQPALPDDGGPYRGVMNFARRRIPWLSRLGADPSGVGRAVCLALTAARPRPRRVVGVDAAIVTGALWVVPPRLIYRITSLPAVLSTASWRRAVRRSRRRHPTRTAD